jgi:hypothetical protein
VSRIGADCGDSDDIESDGNVSSNSNGSTSSLSEGSKECAVDVGDASSGEAADARSRNVERHSKIEDKCGVSSGGSGGGDGRISGGVDLWSGADWAANIYGRKGDGLDEYRAYGEYSERKWRSMANSTPSSTQSLDDKGVEAVFCPGLSRNSSSKYSYSVAASAENSAVLEQRATYSPSPTTHTQV